jgi:hypothetical protein
VRRESDGTRRKLQLRHVGRTDSVVLDSRIQSETARHQENGVPVLTRISLATIAAKVSHSRPPGTESKTGLRGDGNSLKYPSSLLILKGKNSTFSLLSWVSPSEAGSWLCGHLGLFDRSLLYTQVWVTGTVVLLRHTALPNSNASPELHEAQIPSDGWR